MQLKNEMLEHAMPEIFINIGRLTSDESAKFISIYGEIIETAQFQTYLPRAERSFKNIDMDFIWEIRRNLTQYLRMRDECWGLPNL